MCIWYRPSFDKSGCAQIFIRSTVQGHERAGYMWFRNPQEKTLILAHTGGSSNAPYAIPRVHPTDTHLSHGIHLQNLDK